MHNKTLTAIVLLLIISASAAAQKPPKQVVDLSGIWVLEKKEQKHGDKTTNSFEQITIVQTAETLKISFEIVFNNETSKFDRLYFLDGRGEINPLEGEPKINVASKTWAKNDRVVMEYSVLTETNKNSPAKTSKVLKLSKDGQTLTLQSEISIPQVYFASTKAVYKRQ